MASPETSQRPWHILSPTKGECVPERLIVVAVEPLVSYPAAAVQEHTFGYGYARCYWLKDGRCQDQQGQHLDCPDDFWRVLDSWRSKRSCTWIYAHNMGYVLTLLGFWDLLDAGGDTLVSAVISDPPTIVTTRRKGRLIRYVDTQNYWRDNQQRGSESVHCPGQAERSALGSLPPRSGHLASQVAALASRLQGLIGSLAATRAGAWAATAAGVAWNVYRHSFLAPNIYIHGNSDVLKLERSALRGGRLEARKSGWINETVTAVDCNSMYPAIMATEQQPCKLIAYFQEGCKRVLHDALRGLWCCAEVTLSAGHQAFPFPTSNGTSYSTGAGRTTLCGAELLAARDSAAISAVHELSVYEVADLFSGYVNYMYPRKLAAHEMGEHAEAGFYKLCLNSLAGKFAQKPRRWIDDDQARAPDRYIEWWGQEPTTTRPIRYRAIAGHCQRLGVGPEPRHTLPCITAGVAASGRVALERCIQLAGESRVLYCDTDSIHVTRDGEHRLHRSRCLHPNRLGAWKTVVSGSDAHYWGPKHYRVGDHYVCNYLSATATEIAHGTYLQDSKQGLERVLASGIVDRVLVGERILTLPADRWGRHQPVHELECIHHECREYTQETLHKTSQLPSLW